MEWICSAGYEKLVPPEPTASKALGGVTHIDISMGANWMKKMGLEK